MLMSVPERNNNSDLIKLKRNELSLGKNQAGACPDIGQPRAFEIVDFRWKKKYTFQKIEFKNLRSHLYHELLC